MGSQGGVGAATGDGARPQYRVYGRRWLVLLCFCLLSVGNQIPYGTFTTISSEAALHFNVGYIAIDFASLVFLVMFVPSSVIVPLLVNKGGYRVTMYTAAVATVVGVWVRMIDANSYTAVIIGQTLAAVGQPIIFANIPAVSQAWFGEQERALATGSMFVANNIVGVGVAMQMPAFLAPTAESIPFCMLIEAVAVTVLVGVFMLGYAPKPPTPPSASAALQVRASNAAASPNHPRPRRRDWSARSDEDNREWLLDNSSDAVRAPGATMSFKHALAHLFSNVHWLLVVGMNGLIVAVFSALPTFGDRFMESFGYSNTYFALLGGVFLIAGAAATFVVTPILDRTHAFKLIIGVLCGVCTVAMLVASWQMRPHNNVLLVVLFGIVGAAYVPTTAALVELGCEVAYPVPESTSSGILFMVCQVMAIMFVVVANRFMAAGLTRDLRWVMSAAVALTLVLLAFFKGKLKRLHVDQAATRTHLGAKSRASIDVPMPAVAASP